MSQPIRGQGSHLVFPIVPKNTNFVEDIEILLPVKFRWILFSGFRGEVENVSANQTPGRPSCFSDRPEKHKLVIGRWDLAFYQVSLNSVQRFQRRSRKCEKLTTDDGRRTTDDGQRVITIVHLSLRLRCTKKHVSFLQIQRGVCRIFATGVACQQIHFVCLLFQPPDLFPFVTFIFFFKYSNSCFKTKQGFYNVSLRILLQRQSCYRAGDHNSCLLKHLKM